MSPFLVGACAAFVLLAIYALSWDNEPGPDLGQRWALLAIMFAILIVGIH